MNGESCLLFPSTRKLLARRKTEPRTAATTRAAQPPTRRGGCETRSAVRRAQAAGRAGDEPCTRTAGRADAVSARQSSGAWRIVTDV